MDKLSIIKDALINHHQVVILTHKTELHKPTIVLRSYAELSLYDICLSDYDVSVNAPTPSYIQSILPSDNIIRVGSWGELVTIVKKLSGDFVVIRNRNLSREFFDKDIKNINITFTDEYDNQNIYKAWVGFENGKRVLLNGIEVKNMKGSMGYGRSVLFELVNGKEMESYFDFIEKIEVLDENRKDYILYNHIKENIFKKPIILNKDSDYYEVFENKNEYNIDESNTIHLLNKKNLDIVEVNLDDIWNYELVEDGMTKK